jgi:hypothetical protein
VITDDLSFTSLYSYLSHISDILNEECILIYNKTAEQMNHSNMNRFTLGKGLAGLHWSPPTKTKFGKNGRGNSKSQ